MIDSLELGIWIPDHLSTRFQFVQYSNGAGIQMFGIQIPLYFFIICAMFIKSSDANYLIAQMVWIVKKHRFH
jgi:hypothetical protein